ncbi:hypothetical protein ANN_00416, partial [Periplaneta americana]
PCIEIGIASPLLGVTANESETAATPGHQRQQQQQQQQQQQSATQLNGTTTNNVNNTNTTLANTKEKTPMCLVNELARFNKIQHQYRLTNEQGPAHKKRFTVTLKLGDEEYSAEGASIKKAQHSAASEALEHTQYKHPPPKTQRNIRLGKSNITPTVELNALAMKRGEPAVYTFMETPHHHGNHSGAPHNPYLPPPAPPGHNFNYRGMYNQVRGFPNYDQNRRNVGTRGPVYTTYDSSRYHHYGKGPGGFQPPLYLVSLRVGIREFLGEGPTAQAARHDAASKALHQLKSLPLPEESLHHTEGVIQENGTTCGLENDPNADLKSPISLVHEIALKRNLPVNFEVVSEKGPPHMRTFVTKCTVGDKVTTGEGNGKKVSKKRAAEKMLEELKKLPPQSPTNMATSMARLKRKANPGKKKTRNLIKVYPQEQKAEPEYGEDINPISRLIQIQQARKEREPVYSLLEERGVPRRREFVMEVSIGQHSCTGTGPNKKLAKRAAAEGLLQLLGYSRPSAQPAKPSIKTGDTNQDMDKSRKKRQIHEESIRCAQSLNIVPEDALFHKNEHFLNVTKIRNLLRSREFDIWCRHPQKGKGVVLFKQYPGANKWICKHKGLSNSEWRDGIKMVGNVAVVCAVPGRSQDNRCRHCHNEVETLAHVLGSCPHGEALRNARHHQVRSIIATALKHADYNTFEEVHGLSVTGSTWCIDIIAFKESTRSGYIIDPTMHFETDEEQPAEVDNEKKNIYNPTIPYYLNKYQLKELEVIGLLVGARGTATLFMKDVFKRLGIPTSIIPIVTLAALKGSIALLKNHLYSKSNQVTFLEEEKVVELPTGGSSGRQLVPGLLLMADNTAGNYGHTPTKNSGVNLQTTAAIAKELLKGGNSPTAEALVKSAAAVGSHKNSAAPPSMAKPSLQQQNSQTQSSQVVRPKDQLLYLAQLLGFQVQFSDFPKGNHSEFLSLVSLSTDPPQVCHGAGQTTDASHDQAALTALRALSEMGLDSVAPSGSGMKKDSGQQGAQGD